MKRIIKYNFFNENNKCDSFIRQIKDNISNNDYYSLFDTLINTLNNNCDINNKYIFNNTLFYLFINSLKNKYIFNENIIKNIIDLFINNGSIEIENIFKSTPMIELNSQKRYNLIKHIIIKHKNYKIYSNLIYLNILTNKFNTDEKIKLLDIYKKSEFFNFYQKNKANSYFFDLLPLDVQNHFPNIKMKIKILKKTNTFNL